MVGRIPAVFCVSAKGWRAFSPGGAARVVVTWIWARPVTAVVRAGNIPGTKPRKMVRTTGPGPVANGASRASVRRARVPAGRPRPRGGRGNHCCPSPPVAGALGLRHGWPCAMAVPSCPGDCLQSPRNSDRPGGFSREIVTKIIRNSVPEGPKKLYCLTGGSQARKGAPCPWKASAARRTEMAPQCSPGKRKKRNHVRFFRMWGTPCRAAGPFAE